MGLLSELRRRNVFRVGIAYVVLAWLLAQVADLLLENFHAPDWVIQSFLVLLLIGFPLAVFFAWAFELTPEGVKREEDVDRTRSITRQTGRKLDIVIIVLLALGLAYFFWESRFSGPEGDGVETGFQAPVASTAIAEPAASPAPAAASQSGVSALSIAVLPFVNMSGDPDNEFFSDGVSEEILNVLARIPELKVAARTSAFSYKGTRQKIDEIARELKVANVLEGSVRKSGNTVRVTAQLIKADDGFHLWSETYDRELDNIFAIQDEIAQAIAAALKVSLKLSDNAAGNRTGTNSLEAYQHYLQGMALWHLRTPANLYASIEEFSAAIAIDPDFARAHAGLALAWVVLPGYDVRQDPEEAYRNSRAAAQRALQLEPDLPEAMSAMGNLAVNEMLIEEARTWFERSIAINPSLATTWQWYANMLSFIGEVQDAGEKYQVAMELDPRSRIIPYNYSWNLFRMGRLEEAIEANLKGLETSPDFPDGIETAMLFALVRNDCSGVERFGNRLAELLGKTENTTGTYVALCEAEDPAVRSALAATISGWSIEPFEDPGSPNLAYTWELVLVLVEMGEFEAAIDNIRRQWETDRTDNSQMAWYRSTPTPNGRRFSCDPRAIAVFEHFNLPPRPPQLECQ